MLPEDNTISFDNSISSTNSGHTSSNTSSKNLNENLATIIRSVDGLQYSNNFMVY